MKPENIFYLTHSTLADIVLWSIEKIPWNLVFSNVIKKTVKQEMIFQSSSKLSQTIKNSRFVHTDALGEVLLCRRSSPSVHPTSQAPSCRGRRSPTMPAACWSASAWGPWRSRHHGDTVMWRGAGCDKAGSYRRGWGRRWRVRGP
jgi:hypothetical protein